jgi:hypothetical protein
MITPTIEQIIENWLDLANQTMCHADNTLQHGFVSAASRTRSPYSQRWAW